MEKLANGVSQSRLSYDSLGRLVTELDVLGRQTTHHYDGYGREVGLVREGVEERTVFDELGRTVAHLQGSDTVETLRLGLDGSVLERRVPGSGSQWMQRDGAGNVIRQGDSTGLVAVRVVGVGGVDSLTIDALGATTTNVADLLGRPVEVKDARGFFTRFGYDDRGELAWLEDNEHNRTRFEIQVRDTGAIRKIKRTVYPDSSEETVMLGAWGQVVKEVDGLGQITEHSYDRWHQPIAVIRKDAQGNLLEDTLRFHYDAQGRLTKTERGADWDSTEYDSASQVVRTVQMVDGEVYALSFGYDPLTRIRTVTLPDGSTQKQSRTPQGLLDSLWLGSRLVANFQYRNGLEQSRTLGNGIEGIRRYDQGGRLSGLTYRRGDSALFQLGFGFDTVGNLSSIRRPLSPVEGEAMRYTPDHQLLGWEQGELGDAGLVGLPKARQEWTLDSRGNWSNWWREGVQEERSHNEVNELTSRATTGLTWDRAGNLLSEGNTSYSWNARGLLQEVTRGGVSLGQYGYDLQGRRSVKRVGALKAVFIYDGWQCVYQKVTGSGVDTTKTFVYGNYIDEPVCLLRKWGTTSDTSYYLQGNNYNVEVLTDRVGAVVEMYSYSPYGAVTAYTGKGADAKWFTADDVSASVSAKGNALTFQGRELDGESGVMYFRKRYYSPGIGRFISRDPIRLAGDTLNYYGFVKNAPFVNSDPMGLSPKKYYQCNCIGWALTGLPDIWGTPQRGESILSYVSRLPLGWKCKETNGISACKCKCDQNKMAVVIHINTDKRNAGKNPLVDNGIIWGAKDGIGTDFHALRGKSGCSSEYTNVAGAGTPDDVGKCNPSDADMSKWISFKKALCCCQDK